MQCPTAHLRYRTPLIQDGTAGPRDALCKPCDSACGRVIALARISGSGTRPSNQRIQRNRYLCCVVSGVLCHLLQRLDFVDALGVGGAVPLGVQQTIPFEVAVVAGLSTAVV